VFFEIVKGGDMKRTIIVFAVAFFLVFVFVMVILIQPWRGQPSPPPQYENAQDAFEGISANIHNEIEGY